MQWIIDERKLVCGCLQVKIKLPKERPFGFAGVYFCASDRSWASRAGTPKQGVFIIGKVPVGDNKAQDELMTEMREQFG